MNKNKSSLKRYFLLLLVLLTIYSSWSLFVSKNFALHSDSGTEMRFEIEDNSTLENIITILKNKGRISHVWSFEFMAKIKRYDNNIQSGIVTLKGDYTNNELINQLRNPNRKIINLQIPENVRLIENMITILEDSIGFEKGELKSYLDTSSFLSDNNLTIETLPSLFIPNTYQIYDNISVSSFLKRIKNEYNIFWNKERILLCNELGITKIEVSVLASIVEQEQDKKIDERPKIARLYLNRLNNPSVFPYLQADPTVKFANKDFGIKQLLNKHTRIDNPYNTYKNKGLPPGPICIPSIHAIDAVLNASKHNFYFMCAGSNGDGYHEFTSTNSQHNKKKVAYKKYQGLK